MDSIFFIHEQKMHRLKASTKPAGTMWHAGVHSINQIICQTGKSLSHSGSSNATELCFKRGQF